MAMPTTKGDAVSTPEAEARKNIDRQLEAAGWVVQDIKKFNLTAGLGVAVREVPLSTGEVDYMLIVVGWAAEVLAGLANHP